MSDEYGAGDFKPIPHIGGMTPFACEYIVDGDRYSITLYGTDATQVVNDNCDKLESLRVVGVMDSIAPAIKRNE